MKISTANAHGTVTELRCIQTF